jgi:hypothetical protein
MELEKNLEDIKKQLQQIEPSEEFIEKLNKELTNYTKD